MVVVATTMTSDQIGVDQHAVLKRVKEFRSLENDICNINGKYSEGFDPRIQDQISKTVCRHDFSASLPNLSSTIILFNQSSLVDLQDSGFQNGSSLSHIACSGIVKKCGRRSLSSSTDKNIQIYSQHKDICDISNFHNSLNNDEVCNVTRQKCSSDAMCNGEEPTNIQTNTQTNDLDHLAAAKHNSITVQECDDEVNANCENDTLSDSTLSLDNQVNNQGDISNSCDLIESSQLLRLPGDQVHEHSCEDRDLEQIDELTRLKESPISSPGNTLDSRTSSSLARTDSFGRTDASSYSSVSSLSADIPSSSSTTATVVDNNKEETSSNNAETFVEVSLKNQNTFEKSTSSQDSGIDVHAQPQQPGAKPKKKGLTLGGFLTRNLFSRKPKEDPGSAPGWKLFGKVPPKEVPQREPAQISQDYQSRKDSLTSSTSMPSTVLTPCDKAKKCDIEVLSTTALILEQRPMGLPSKDPEEELKHRQMYEQMVEAAKKKEQKDTKQRKKQLEQQLKYEDSMSAALKVWITEILPNWETMQYNKKVLELWWRGIPPSVRGKVWKLAFGNDLNLTKDLYHICLNRAKERLKLIEDWCGDTDSVCSHMSGFSDHSSSREASVELIKLDVSRTFPHLCIFQKGGPYHELLQGLLGAYACYRPDVGYVQGMSFIAAVLILNMDVQDAFICFANLLNRPCQIAFFRLDESLMKSYFDTYEEFFEENLPKLFSHFIKLNITPDLYIIDWMFTLYAKSVPLDVASRVWDVFGRDGEEFLFRTALGILKLYEDILINMDFIHLAQFLTKLPEDLQSDELFKCIDKIKMCIDTRRFKEVLASNRDPQARET